MDSQYWWEMSLISLRENYWMFLLWLLLVIGFICWNYRRLTVFILCLPILFVLWGYFESTGQFSSYDTVRRDGAFIYNQEQYSQQIDEWVKEVEDSNGRWVSMVSCPQVSDNGTEYVWVEFAYQPNKPWYEPIGFRLLGNKP